MQIMEAMPNAAPWSDGSTDLLKRWCEKASCMEWMHGWASAGAGRMNTLLTVPAIALSAATGVMTTTAPTSFMMHLMTATSLASAVAASAAKVMRSAEKAEEHRNAALAWGRYLRKYRLQLSLPPADREPMRATLDNSKLEYDNLMEAYPSLTPHVVRDFENQHAGFTGARPDVTSGPTVVQIYGEVAAVEV